MLINRAVIALLQSPMWRLLPSWLTALRITGRHSGRSVLVPVQFALDGDAWIVYPSRYAHKNWWKNLLAPAGLDVLVRRRWVHATGQVLTPGSVGYDAARNAYRRRWPLIRTDPRAPLVAIAVTPGTIDVRAPRWRTSAATGIAIGSLAFGVISAAAGAVLGMFFNGAGVPLTYLDGTAFDSYFLPGVILGVVVGGTQLLGLIGMLRRTERALLLSAIAGFGMLIWIFVEMAVIGEFSFLQAIYFALGIGELAAVVALLGIAPRVVAARRSVG